jgi:hypothetical protein
MSQAQEVVQGSEQEPVQGSEQEARKGIVVYIYIYITVGYVAEKLVKKSDFWGVFSQRYNTLKCFIISIYFTFSCQGILETKV